MRRSLGVSVACLIIFITSSIALTAEASADAPIKAGEHYLGMVNATHQSPVVKTICPGPVGPNSTGRVAGKQTMSVVRIRRGHGYTGLFNSVYAWFKPAPGGARPIQMHFTHYSSPQLIPNSVRVPCGGTGTAVFSSCPYLAPCAVGWITDNVKVKFEDVAA